MYHPKNKP